MLIRERNRDGKIINQLCCPDCETWGDLDDDQYNGRVSIQCPVCDYHETINLSALEVYDGI
jgi:hypothetical protein